MKHKIAGGEGLDVVNRIENNGGNEDQRDIE